MTGWCRVGCKILTESVSCVWYSSTTTWQPRSWKRSFEWPATCWTLSWRWTKIQTSSAAWQLFVLNIHLNLFKQFVSYILITAHSQCMRLRVRLHITAFWHVSVVLIIAMPLLSIVGLLLLGRGALYRAKAADSHRTCPLTCVSGQCIVAKQLIGYGCSLGW